MRVLITGSNGFIGSSLVRDSIMRGYRVRCLVRKTSDLSLLQGLDVEWVYGELRDPETLTEAVRGVDRVYHLAGVTRGRTALDYFQGNHQATVNLLQACERYGDDQQKVIFASSQAAGGPSVDLRAVSESDTPHPISLYGQSKLRAEEAVLQFSRRRPATIIRPPSVYGPGDKDFLILFQNINRRFLPMVGRGDQRISLVFIDDLIAGIQLAADKDQANGRIFYLCGDQDASFAEIAQAIAEALDKRPITLHLPLTAVEWVTRLAALISNWSGKASILNPDKLNEMMQPAWLCSNRKAKEELGFRPLVNLWEGMAKTAAWYRDKNWL